MPAKKLYAIGFKDWVEIRAADKPPRGEVTQISKPGAKDKQIIGYQIGTENGHYKVMPVYQDIDTPMKIKIIAYIGGRVVEVIPRRKFTGICGPCANGKRRELTQGWIRYLVAAGYKKLYKYITETNPPIEVDGTVGGQNVKGADVGIGEVI